MKDEAGEERLTAGGRKHRHLKSSHSHVFGDSVGNYLSTMREWQWFTHGLRETDKSWVTVFLAGSPDVQLTWGGTLSYFPATDSSADGVVAQDSQHVTSWIHVHMKQFLCLLDQPLAEVILATKSMRRGTSTSAGQMVNDDCVQIEVLITQLTVWILNEWHMDAVMYYLNRLALRRSSN